MNLEKNKQIDQELKSLQSLFKSYAIDWGIGASYLMYYRGIDVPVNDCDILIAEKDIITAQKILSNRYEKLPQKSKSIFKSSYFQTYQSEFFSIDVIAGFTIYDDKNYFEYSFTKESIDIHPNDPYPLMYLEDWLMLYMTMKRDFKVKLLDDYFKNHVINTERIKKLLKMNPSNRICNELKKYLD